MAKRTQKTFNFKMMPSPTGKSAEEIIDKIVKKTIEKVLAQNEKSFYNDGK